jgi:hypothetical protein
VKASESASVYLNAAFSFRMDGFIVCAERLIDQLMFYQCLYGLRKHATPASGRATNGTILIHYFDSCRVYRYSKSWRLMPESCPGRAAVLIELKSGNAGHPAWQKGNGRREVEKYVQR